MSFVARKLRFTFTLGQGSFGEAPVSSSSQSQGGANNTGQNTVTVSGLRASVQVNKAGAFGKITSSISVWGMDLSTMNQLSTLGFLVTLVRRNSVLVEAGDDESGYATVFAGTIKNAWFDGNSQPNGAFRVEAQGAFVDALYPVPATSFKGPTSIDNILSSLAGKGGYDYINNGVDVIFSNPYYPGTLGVQIESVIRDAGCNWNQLENNQLVIWPRGGSRGGQVPEVSAATGMIGYPTYSSYGMTVRTIFNPVIQRGCLINLVTSLKLPASGSWFVYSVDLNLESQVPHGQWLMVLGVCSTQDAIAMNQPVAPSP